VPTSLATSVLNYLSGKGDEMVSFLEKLVTIESPTDRPDCQQPVLDALGNVLSDSSYSATLHEQHGSPFLVAGDATEGCQLLVGHSDTVWPDGTLKEMPFVSTGAQVRGPGTFDMKAGLVQGAFALRALAVVGLEPEVPVCVFINSDEERASPSSTGEIERLAQLASRAFILEPALGPRGLLKTRRKGGGVYRIEVRGKAAHAGLEPAAGASAILGLTQIVQRLFALNDPARGMSVNVGQIDGGVRPNVIAPVARAVVDVRADSNEDLRALDESIRSLETEVPGTSVHIDSPGVRLPMRRSQGTARLMEMAVIASQDLGMPVGEASAGGLSDGNTTSLYTPTLDGLGAVGDGAHARHEFIYADRMIERAALLALLVASA
jgi:glutamate carboxypeptidase